MKFIPLDSALWEQYPGAYGSVSGEIAFLMGESTAPRVKLRRLDPEEKDQERVAFDNLCENLSHQMSFYPALYLALPYMVKLLGQKAGDYDWQLLIFSEIGICLATDVTWENEPAPRLPEDITESCREAAAILAERAERFLKENRKKLRREGTFERRRLCLGLYGLLGDRREAFALVMNQWETCYVHCTHCGYLDEDLELIDGKQRRKLRPLRFWQKKPAAFTRFRRILHQMGDWEGEELLACYYGGYVCPACGKRSDVMEGLIGAFDPQFDAPEFKEPAKPEEKAPAEPETKKPETKKGNSSSGAAGQAAPSPLLDLPDILEDNALSHAGQLCREAYPEAFALLDQGGCKEAADWCARRFEEAPDWRLQVLRAWCFKGLRKTPEMDRCLTAALELDPDNVLILRARCPTVSTRTRYQRHVGDLTRLMELDPAHAREYLVSRAYRLHWTGDDEGARRDLKQALEGPEGRKLWGASVDFRYLWQELFPAEG
jgi:tetratricopeptide (TPR) repeat protein